jgi:hypothetical protein
MGCISWQRPELSAGWTVMKAVGSLTPDAINLANRIVRVILGGLIGVLLAACVGGASTLGGVGVAPTSGAVSTGESLPAALQLWAAFPVDASPRPIVLVGGSVVGPHGVYGNGETKLALLCGDYAPPTGLPSGPSTAGGYRLISASKAFAALQPKQHTGGCAEPHTPLTLTEARLGQAAYDTDRGARTFPAWVFSFAGVEGPVSVLAIAPRPPSSRHHWGPGF